MFRRKCHCRWLLGLALAWAAAGTWICGAATGEVLQATSFVLEAGGLRAVFSDFQGVGSDQEVVDYRMLGPRGETVIQKIPGRLIWPAVVLKRALGRNMDLWTWREMVTNGQMKEARRNGTLTAYDAHGLEVARWSLENTWPSALRVDFTPGTAGAQEVVTLVHEGTGMKILPELTLSQPVANKVFIAPTSITMQATVTKWPEVVQRVDFFAGATLLGRGTASGAQYSLVWTSPPLGDFTLSAVATTVDSNTVASANPVRISIQPLLTFELWRTNSQRFTSAELNQSEISGLLADPDGDGQPNLVEYAFNTLPRQVDAQQRPRLQRIQSTTGTNTWTLTYRRRIGGSATGLDRYSVSDLQYYIEYSPNARDWDLAGPRLQSAVATLNTDQVSETVVMTLNPASLQAGQGFFRVRVALR